ncbi:MAG: Cytoplasmic GTPase/eEF2-like protein (ribosomal biogenesis) [Sclerophora amabilis]|nr:MAG: Cytoplasmic GTPase/eEF2-like protein (ribosomal biogenesis) [Sclerophora amabilis]
MPVVNPEKLIGLQKNSEGIRNICILAHVDHGKTSLTDALIATNGIISPKLAGKIRYLDSRPDEQLRGITMESSAISLHFSMLRRSQADEAPSQKEYLINLIDSPGHIDFSSEVSTASRLCDGAVVLVDAVEGVCSQTVTVLRHTWTEHLQPLLVINKIDRLVTELKMSAGEAYTHLSKLLEQVNAVVGSFFQGERMEEDLKWRERVEERVAATAAKEKERADRKAAAPVSEESFESGETLKDDSTSGVYEEKDDESLYFAPERNNVIFSSAVDGWAFTVKQFAALYEKKLGIKRATLEKVLWGDYYLDPKTKRILGHKHLKGRLMKPMFVQLVLDNIWAVYEATTGGSKGKGDPNMVEKITKSLSITLPPHVLRSKDPRVLLTTLFAAWLPLSTALLVSVIEHLPSPPAAQAARLPAMIGSSPGASAVDETIRRALIEFQHTKEDPVVAYVSKMVAVPESELPHNKRRQGALSAEEARELGRKKRAEIAQAQAMAYEANQPDSMAYVTEALDDARIDEKSIDEELGRAEEQKQDPEHLIGFARLYSGVLSVGDEIYVLPPKFSPSSPDAPPEPRKATITALYLLMGRGLEPLTSVPAGVVFGVEGLEGHILKSGTLCTQLPGAVNLAGVSIASQPIVRVALEPTNPSDLDKMITGLRLLEQSDPCAEYEVLESGEHVILTAGELHLERCLKDLRERFARCEIQAGEPIVPYRESIVSAAEMAPPQKKDLSRGTVIAVTTSKQITVRVRVRPLPTSVTEVLEKSAGSIRSFYSGQKNEEDIELDIEDEDDVGENDVTGGPTIAPTSRMTLDTLKTQLKLAFAEAKGERDVWANAVERIATFGPRRVGPNVLIDATKIDCCHRLFEDPHDSKADPSSNDGAQQTTTNQLTPRDLADKISYAFQLATAQGPLCSEPVQGVAVFIEEVTITATPEDDNDNTTRENPGRLTGEVIKTVRDSIRQGFLDWSPRLLLAMYSCEIQASAEVLGRVYGVITRRRGRILSESLKEGTPFFTILSLLPVAESFGFSDEIRKRTSGAASPQLIFQGFETLDQDPFWVPFTEEEIEDLGELADKENVAKRYMDAVRVRKGLFVRGKKLVVNAEKQKTLKR